MPSLNRRNIVIVCFTMNFWQPQLAFFTVNLLGYFYNVGLLEQFIQVWNIYKLNLLFCCKISGKLWERFFTPFFSQCVTMLFVDYSIHRNRALSPGIKHQRLQSPNPRTSLTCYPQTNNTEASGSTPTGLSFKPSDCLNSDTKQLPHIEPFSTGLLHFY